MVNDVGPNPIEEEADAFTVDAAFFGAHGALPQTFRRSDGWEWKLWGPVDSRGISLDWLVVQRKLERYLIPLSKISVVSIPVPAPVELAAPPRDAGPVHSATPARQPSRRAGRG